MQTRFGNYCVGFVSSLEIVRIHHPEHNSYISPVGWKGDLTPWLPPSAGPPPTRLLNCSSSNIYGFWLCRETQRMTHGNEIRSWQAEWQETPEDCACKEFTVPVANSEPLFNLKVIIWDNPFKSVPLLKRCWTWEPVPSQSPLHQPVRVSFQQT